MADDLGTLVVVAVAAITVTAGFTSVASAEAEPGTSNEGCEPHPPIVITENHGPQGFTWTDPMTGEEGYRPGSGVVRGNGTAEDPYVIEGWCLAVPPGGAVGEAAGLTLRGTDAHVVVQANRAEGMRTSLGIALHDVENASLQANTVAGNEVGALVEGSQAIEVRANHVSQNQDGVYVTDSQAVEVRNNTFRRNDGDALNLTRSEQAAVEDNTLERNQAGIVLTSSSTGNILRNNIFTWNRVPDIRLAGSSDGNEIVANTVDDNDVSLEVVGSTENTIARNDVAGIELLEGSHDNILEGNRVVGAHGIYIEESDRNLLRGNTVEENRGMGVRLESSRANVVEGNTISQNSWAGVGISNAVAPGDHVIRNNTIAGNDDFGIRLGNTGDNLLAENRIVGTGGYGISLFAVATRDNRIVGNDLAENVVGVRLAGSADENLVEANEITENQRGIVVESFTAPGFRTTPDDNVFVHNDIEANTEAALVADDLDDPVEARENWWGHGTGPDGGAEDCRTGAVADGEGGTIVTKSAAVCFDPWLTDPYPDAGAG